MIPFLSHFHYVISIIFSNEIVFGLFEQFFCILAFAPRRTVQGVVCERFLHHTSSSRPHHALHPKSWPRGHVARNFWRHLVRFYLCSRVVINMPLEAKRGR
jgi:hypothetical protein